MPPSGTVIFGSVRKALFKCGAYVVIECIAEVVFFLRVNVEFSLKINKSILFHPLRVVGGIGKGGDESLGNKEGKERDRRGSWGA